MPITTPLPELLAVERISLDHPAMSRRDVLDELARLLGGADTATRESIRDDLGARERAGSTGIGNGVAFPHARVTLLTGIRVAVLRTTKAIDFDALDGLPADLFVGMAGPKEMRREYLSLLSRMSWLLREEESRDGLRDSRSPDEIVALLTKIDAGYGPRT